MWPTGREAGRHPARRVAPLFTAGGLQVSPGDQSAPKALQTCRIAGEGLEPSTSRL